MKKDRKSLKPFPVHPQAQVIITGKPLSPEQVETVGSLMALGFCVKNWLGSDGTVGHIDSVLPGTNFDKFQQDWSKLMSCQGLDLGITVMSGPPGSPVIPVASYSLKHGNLSRQENVHFSHPPPRRLKQPAI